MRLSAIRFCSFSIHIANIVWQTDARRTYPTTKTGQAKSSMKICLPWYERNKRQTFGIVKYNHRINSALLARAKGGSSITGQLDNSNPICDFSPTPFSRRFFAVHGTLVALLIFYSTYEFCGHTSDVLLMLQMFRLTCQCLSSNRTGHSLQQRKWNIVWNSSWKFHLIVSGSLIENLTSF